MSSGFILIFHISQFRATCGQNIPWSNVQDVFGLFLSQTVNHALVLIQLTIDH